ncbi:hypothetical protein EKL98_13650 [Flavobacterium bomense]|uniref:Uncharacterized protein n=1 Tax=Flavobacterium bomense TaxID=2497483 RepID=A0A432CH01_9FLAO|nr:hypothetical protein [Flavobacterium bomense]RTZ02270.1 hypothetical protein EKL98_13650 [Flavobacterium bomense]
MLSKTISTLKYVILEYRFYFLSITSLLALLIYNHNKTLALKKKLVQINKELQQQQVTFEKRQKLYNEKMKQQHAEIELMQKK